MKEDDKGSKWLMERLAGKAAASSGRSDGDHTHCWHAHRGPIMMVLKDGHILQKCCHCEETRQVHRDHLFDGSSGMGGSLDGHSGSGKWLRGGNKPKLSCNATHDHL